MTQAGCADWAVNDHWIHKLTSIGRPLDGSCPTNRAVLVVTPSMALFGLAWSLHGGAAWTAALADALVFALSAFGSWAISRELLPDDHAAAFVGVVLAFVACLASSPGLLVWFVTLGLVRMVNRTSGLPARTSDSIALTILSVWVVYATQSPWFGGVAAMAFVLDGVLQAPLRKQWLLAFVCLGAMVVYTVDYDVALLHFTAPDSLLEWVTVVVLVLFALNMVRLKKIHSRGDVGQQYLDLERVKGGMAIVILATLQGMGDMSDVLVLLAAMGGVCLGLAFRRAFRNPVPEPLNPDPGETK